MPTHASSAWSSLLSANSLPTGYQNSQVAALNASWRAIADSIQYSDYMKRQDLIEQAMHVQETDPGGKLHLDPRLEIATIAARRSQGRIGPLLDESVERVTARIAHAQSLMAQSRTTSLEDTQAMSTLADKLEQAKNQPMPGLESYQRMHGAV